jgi:hypothetical protein
MLNILALEHGLRYVILDPITSEETSVSTLRDRTASSSESLLSGPDVVHLFADGYQDLARAIMALSEQMLSDDVTYETCTISLSDSSTAKRSRLKINRHQAGPSTEHFEQLSTKADKLLTGKRGLACRTVRKLVRGQRRAYVFNTFASC